MQFRKAERKRTKLKLALTGVSNSGKTLSSLKIATGMGAKKIALIDSENESSEVYADQYSFEILDIKPPYTITKYNAALDLAQKERFDVTICDSISHAWAGDGGLLMQKEQLDSRGGKQNGYTNWAPISKEHEAFKSKILNFNGHLICTMRSKQDYILQANENGKLTPQKVGLAPIQRDGMEYEFTIVFDLDTNHYATVSKDRTSLFDSKPPFIPSEATGLSLMEWLNTGKWIPSATDFAVLNEAVKKSKIQQKDFYEFISDNYQGKKRVSELDEGQFRSLVATLNSVDPLSFISEIPFSEVSSGPDETEAERTINDMIDPVDNDSESFSQFQ